MSSEQSGPSEPIGGASGRGHSAATVATDRPGRYGKQLVAHLTRRATGEWDDGGEVGKIDFGSGQATLTAAPEGLLLAIDAPPDQLERLEDVVGRHLVRFGARDELVVSWTRDGRPGSEQRNVEDPA